jgi:hypothetical protein
LTKRKTIKKEKNKGLNIKKNKEKDSLKKYKSNKFIEFLYL